MKKRYIAAIFGGVVFLWSLSWFLVVCLKGQPNDAGTFGDMFGAVNALFSGFAFAAIIVTFFLQQKEITRQRFDSSFHSLQNTFEQRLSTIEYKDFTGRSLLNEVRREMKRFFEKVQLSDTHSGQAFIQPEDSLKVVIPGIDYGYRKAGLFYLENLFAILNYIQQNKILGDDEKRIYLDLIRSGVSYDEKYIILYFCTLVDNGVTKKLRAFFKDSDFTDSIEWSFFHSSHQLLVKKLKSESV